MLAQHKELNRGHDSTFRHRIGKTLGARSIRRRAHKVLRQVVVNSGGTVNQEF